MRPICPYCHSSNVINNSLTDSPFKLFEPLCSPTALSGLGISLCKYYKINPAIGMVVGAALATAISLAKDKLQQPPLIMLAAPPPYTCNTCLKAFAL